MTEQDAPKRIQLRRTKGWRKPEGAIVVARPSKWGNPFRIVSFADITDPYQVDDGWPCPSLPADERRRMTAGEAVALYRRWITDGMMIAIGRGDGWGNIAIGGPDMRVNLEDLGPYGHVSLHRAPPGLRGSIPGLRGHDLACWCPLEDENGQPVPCHADVLLELANQPERGSDEGHTGTTGEAV